MVVCFLFWVIKDRGNENEKSRCGQIENVIVTLKNLDIAPRKRFLLKSAVSQVWWVGHTSNPRTQKTEAGEPP